MERFEVASAHQGQEGLDLVREAVRRDERFALVFMDIHMPPGWDGIESLARMWKEEPDLQAVLCSAYSDYSLADIHAVLGPTDKLLFLRKPFEPIEVYQIAHALTEKWNQERRLAEASARLAAQVEALERTAANTRALLDVIPDALLRLDARGVCVDFRAPRAGAARLARGVPLGKHLTEVIPREVALEVLRRVQEAGPEADRSVLEFQEPSEDGPRSYEARVVNGGALDAVVLIRDITERSRAEATEKERRVQEEVIRAQAEILASLSSPIIPISDEVVVVPLIGDLDVARVARAQEIVVKGMVERRAEVAILDITGVPTMSAEAGDALVQIARAVRLVGAEVVLTGLRPAIAQMLVALGVNLESIVTTGTLQSGIALAMNRRNRKGDAPRGAPARATAGASLDRLGRLAR